MSQNKDENQAIAEKRILEELRTLKPFERIEIIADREGKPGVYVITRTSKAVLIIGTMNYTK
jgi:hypothetical protein